MNEKKGGVRTKKKRLPLGMVLNLKKNFSI